MASEDTEITLGVGRLVGLFFLLAAICGVFLSIGYSLGKSTAREQALDEPPSQVLAAASPGGGASDQTDAKLLGAVAPKSDATPTTQEQSSAASNVQNNLTFYKAVQQYGTNTPAQAKDSPAVPATAAPAANETPVATVAQNVAPPKEPTVSQSSAAPISHSVPVTGAGTIVVQIAAVTREDDAVALAGALRKKDYSVIVVKNPAINDKFFHVQVGPFTTIKDADAMKAKLVAEGYNPIVKK
jgi:DedD protein